VNPSGINSAGHSALAEAVRNDQAKVVRLLLDRGANPDLITRSGHTPLTLAITRDRTDLIDLLLRAGAVEAFGRRDEILPRLTRPAQPPRPITAIAKN
jgi:ankyrin repeat protein